ncbi:MAG: ABC transporter permease [Phycisphaerales bacterium]|nr:ABC transporter permease [Phycisphaerales bacterium]
MSILANIGSSTIGSLGSFGAFWRFSGRAIALLPGTAMRRRDWALVMPQFFEVGVRTVPVMMITGVFVGLVLAAQAAAQLKSAGLEERMGVLVNLALIKELGPVLAGVMLAGRVGGALTAELGTMNVTEQIDALRAMGTDPIRYLVVPRFLACVLLAPILTLYCDILGAWGGWFVAVVMESIPGEPYGYYTAEAVEKWDLFVGLAKAVVFGGSIGLICCFKGFTCRAGAAGVGRACTSSFVTSFIVILITDFYLLRMMQDIYNAVWGFQPLL